MTQFASTGKGKVKFICQECGEIENIPKDVVEFFDNTDLELDTDAPPQFSCEKCGGVMVPEHYINATGKEFNNRNNNRNQ